MILTPFCIACSKTRFKPSGETDEIAMALTPSSTYFLTNFACSETLAACGPSYTTSTPNCFPISFAPFPA